MPSNAEGNARLTEEDRFRARLIRQRREQRKRNISGNHHPLSHSPPRSYAPAPALRSGPPPSLPTSDYGYAPFNYAPVPQTYVPVPQVYGPVPPAHASHFSNHGRSSSNDDYFSSNCGPFHVDHGSPSPTEPSPPTSPEPPLRSQKTHLRPRKPVPGSFESRSSSLEPPMKPTKSSPAASPSPVANVPLFLRLMAFLEKNSTLHAWICILFLTLLIILICRNTWFSLAGRLSDIYLGFFSFIGAAFSTTSAATVGSVKSTFTYTNWAAAKVYTTSLNSIHQAKSYFNPPPLSEQYIDPDLPPFLPRIGELVDSLKLAQTWIDHFEHSIPATPEGNLSSLEHHKLRTIINRAVSLRTESKTLRVVFNQALSRERVMVKDLIRQMRESSVVSPSGSELASEWCLCASSCWWWCCQSKGVVSKRRMATLLTTLKSALKRARKTHPRLEYMKNATRSEVRDEINPVLESLRNHEAALYSSHRASIKPSQPHGEGESRTESNGKPKLPTSAVTPLNLIKSAGDAAQLAYGVSGGFERLLQRRGDAIKKEAKELESLIGILEARKGLRPEEWIPIEKEVTLKLAMQWLDYTDKYFTSF